MRPGYRGTGRNASAEHVIGVDLYLHVVQRLSYILKCIRLNIQNLKCFCLRQRPMCSDILTAVWLYSPRMRLLIKYSYTRMSCFFLTCFFKRDFDMGFVEFVSNTLWGIRLVNLYSNL